MLTLGFGNAILMNPLAFDIFVDIVCKCEIRIILTFVSTVVVVVIAGYADVTSIRTMINDVASLTIAPFLSTSFQN